MRGESIAVRRGIPLTPTLSPVQRGRGEPFTDTFCQAGCESPMYWADLRVKGRARTRPRASPADP